MVVDLSDAAVTNAVSRLAARVPGALYGFLGGSIVEGFANTTSDIDLLVVTAEPLAGLSIALGENERLISLEDNTVLVSWIGSTRVDVEIRQAKSVESRIVILQSEGPDAFLRAEFSDGWLEFFNDLRIGIPATGLEVLEQRRSDIPWDALSGLLLRRFEFAANSAIDDVAGAVEAADFGAAELSSRIALEAGIDAWLARNGQTNPKSKWRFSKLGRVTNGDRIIDRYWELLAETSENARDSALRRAEDRVYFAQDLLFETNSQARVEH